jgi:general secretion pathway protein G
MMFVFVLIGILATLVTVNVRYYLLKGKQNAARAEISSICAALETYYSVNDRYPDNSQGLAALTEHSEKHPEPLLKQVPIDPWGHPYQYNRPGREGPYEVICFGADGRAGGAGADKDIVSWDLKETASK